MGGVTRTDAPDPERLRAYVWSVASPGSSPGTGAVEGLRNDGGPRQMWEGRGHLCPLRHLFHGPPVPWAGITNPLWMCLRASGSRYHAVRMGTYGENEVPYRKVKDWPEVTLKWHPAQPGEPRKLELKEVVIKA